MSQHNNKIKVICIMGPTASGKSSLAEAISQTLPSELINVDSAQVYKYLNVGSAKPSDAEIKKYHYHLINIREPFELYSVAEFLNDVFAAINSVQARGKLPILVGGTMMYFKVLFDGLANLPEADAVIRAKFDKRIKQEGLLSLYNELEVVDAIAAKKIKPTDPQRIQRALEVYELTGKPISYWHAQQQLKVNQQNQAYEFVKCALIPNDRQWLHNRIERRLKNMIEAGFIEEIKALLEHESFDRESSAMRSVGYRQLLVHLLDDEDLSISTDKAIFATRQLAKRQLTWLRKIPHLQQFDPQSETLLENVLNYVQGHLI